MSEHVDEVSLTAVLKVKPAVIQIRNWYGFEYITISIGTANSEGLV